jgi:predicted extracellular nuclease
VEEVQDESGPTDDATVAASGTYSRLISAIKTAGGPTYDYRQIDPANDEDGGAPGGNIRQAMLFNPARVSFKDRPGGTSTASTEGVAKDGHAQLSFSPGRIDPENAAWQDSRKPLAGEFVFKGHRLIVIANHLIAKLGDQPVFGRFQPPEQPSEDKRIQQARIINGFVAGILDIEPNANIVVLGDMNDFEVSDSIAALKGAQQLFSLVATLPRDRRYSYIYQGNSEVLDQILVSRNLLKSATVQYEIVHVNAEFAEQASDHDPSLVRLLIVR